MNLDDLLITRKMGKILCPTYDKKLTYLGGTTGTSKSVILFCWLVDKIIQSGSSGFFCAESVNKFYQQFIGDTNSIYWAWEKAGLVKYHHNSKGGQKITIKTIKGDVDMFIVNYATSKSWGRILGTSLKWFAVDEGNLANKKMLDEITLRIYRNKGMAMINSNGDSPDNDMYDIVNRCTPDPEFADLMPELEKKYFKSERDDWSAIHFNKEQDLGYMDEETKQALITAFHPDSFLYKTKVLGIRGVGEGLYFNEQDVKNSICDDIKPWLRNVRKSTIGVDTAYSSKSKDMHAIVPITITNDGYLVIHKSWGHNNKSGVQVLADDLAMKVNEMANKQNIREIYIDNADQNMIGTTSRMFPHLAVADSYKAFKIVDRGKLLQQLLKSGKVIIERDNKGLINEFLYTTYSKEPKKQGEWADGGTHFIDALCYALIPYRDTLQRFAQVKRGN